MKELGVWLHGSHVATLYAPKRVGSVLCRYEDSTLDEHPLNTPLLSCSLPTRTGRHEAWPFVNGLLPEGEYRQAMSRLAGVTTSDLLGMLDRFGRDVAGAIVVSADAPNERDARIEGYDDESLADAVIGLAEHPLGLYADSELSIAGLQNKMLVVEKPDGTFARPVHGYPSTDILKVDSQFHTGLVRAEHACLELARAAGLDAAASRVISVGGVDCIVVKRFDRATDASGVTTRIHQEDACQALGINAENQQNRAKYERFGGPRLRQVADLLDVWALNAEDELLRLLGQVVFTVVIGNADAHGKNISVLHDEPGSIQLAPLYDTVPTVLWPKLRAESAMTIGGRSDLSMIGLADIRAEAGTWNLSAAKADARIAEVVERLHTAFNDGAVDVETPAMRTVSQRLDRLMLGDPDLLRR